MTTTEAATALSTTVRNVRHMAATGKFPELRKIPGLGYRFRTVEVNEWLAKVVK